MFERTIYLEGIDPVHIYGVNDNALEFLKSAFPKLRLVVRGNEIKAFGDKPAIDDFEEKLLSLVEYYQKYNSLTRDEMEEFLFPSGKDVLKTHETDKDIIIFGHSGKLIKARTIK